MTSPDPDPSVTPGLTAGGAVPVGDTPPVESSTSGISHREEPPAKVLPWVTISLIALVVVAVLIFFLARAIDLF